MWNFHIWLGFIQSALDDDDNAIINSNKITLMVMSERTHIRPPAYILNESTQKQNTHTHILIIPFSRHKFQQFHRTIYVNILRKMQRNCFIRPKLNRHKFDELMNCACNFGADTFQIVHCHALVRNTIQKFNMRPHIEFSQCTRV